MGQETNTAYQKDNTGTLHSSDGVRLHYKKWLPQHTPKSVIVLAHGLAEHCGRYEHVASHLNSQGHALFGFDFRGHGQSEGKRIYINHFDEYINDLAVVFEQATSAYPGIPTFILAHSMGTTVTLNYLLTRSPKLSGVVLSGTAIMAGNDISPLLISLSGFVGAILPKLPTVALNSSTISRDDAVVQAYHDDPLVYNGKIPARTGAELNRVFGFIQRNLSKLTYPFLIMHGNEDQLTNPEGSKVLYKEAASSDKTLKLWKGLYHEILNEPEQGEVLALINTWINERV